MKRTIAAILAADVAGFSRLVAEDEDDTLRRLQDYSKVFRDEVVGVRGRVFNTAGDAILAEFPSAVEALRAGIAIQEQLRALNADHAPERRVLFRMGLNIGDVVETDRGDLLGDGVNVAARLEGLAEPGGICLSRSVHEAISARVDVGFRDIGPQTLKNIPRPVHAFRVLLPWDGPEETVEPRRWGPRIAAVVALLLVVSGGLAFAFKDTLFDKADATSEVEAPAQAAAREFFERTDLLSVAVVKPAKACFREQVWMSGTIVPRNEVDVGPDDDGQRIQKVIAQPLEKVAKGQALAELVRPDQPGSPVTTLRAPIAGTISQSSAFVGALAATRAPPLFRIVPQGAFELSAEVPMKALGTLAAGQTVAVTPLGATEIAGRVRTVSNDIDGASQVGRARVTLPANAELRQGQFARGVAAIGQRCGIGVPESAIMRTAQGNVVFVSNQGHVEGRLIDTGLTSGEAVEVRSGLDGDEAVLLRAGPFVREGDLVNAVPVSTAAAN